MILELFGLGCFCSRRTYETGECLLLNSYLILLINSQPRACLDTGEVFGRALISIADVSQHKPSDYKFQVQIHGFLLVIQKLHGFSPRFRQ